MSTTVRSLFILLIFVSTSAFAQVRTATIFLVPWDLETRRALDASDAREWAWVRTEMKAPHARSLLEWLKKEDFTSASGVNPPLGIRLVIDFTLEDGSVQSYYASRVTLFEEKSGRARKIDENFRSRFNCFLW